VKEKTMRSKAMILGALVAGRPDQEIRAD